MNELLEKIRSRGYWKVIIRPGTFVANRVPNISDLYPILESRSVQLRGWDFPYLDSKTPVRKGQDWIEQASKWEEYLEFWRFYQSGQFVDFVALDEDWREQSTISAIPKDWKPGKFLDIEDTAFQLTEFFEFASRLALTEAGDEQMHLEITISGLKGRTIRFEPGRVPFRQQKTASISELPYKVDLSRLQLITEARELALKPAVELFKCFGWNPSLEILKDMQDELLHRRSGVAGR